ncbi:MAG: hypothetical protein ACYC5X_07160, partial [Syntrophales bacterium]
EIIPAAAHGRVGQLFVAAGRQHWGTFDAQSGAIELHRKPEPAGEDLLEVAAVQTFLNGGSVFIMPPEKMPDATDLAAVFRY